MRRVLFFGLLIASLTACTKKDKPTSQQVGQPLVSKMTKKDGSLTETYNFSYNANNQLTTVTTGAFTIQVSYNDQKQVKRVEKKYAGGRWTLQTDYTYIGNQVSREERYEELADVQLRHSYSYEIGSNNLPSRIFYINTNNTNSYTADIYYGANTNPSSIISTAGQRTEYQYSNKDFLLFPKNAFIYPWLDIYLTHEYNYYLPLTKELLSYKRTTGNGWQVDLQYYYHPNGTVAKLIWHLKHNTPEPEHIVEYTFDYINR